MLRLRFLLAALLCVALVSVPALAQTAAPAKAPAKAAAKAPAGPKPITIAFTEHKLKNGLRVILSEDHSAPTYSIDVCYNAGSRDERQGRTGFAHLFEHMMFQGSENVGKGEHMLLVQNNGGGMNGTTNNDRTTYFQTLPANQLDLGLFIEADRMRSLVINQANLDNQRNAVQEERRIGIDNAPYGKTYEAIDETAYDNFAYKHSVIGSMADLSAATVEDVAGFFKTYYAPNNAVLTLVGDFNSTEALAKVRKYFESIPSQAPPPPVDMTEPEQTAERRKSLEDAFARQPRLDIVYKVPAGNTADWYALSVLGRVLATGQSSRLYQKLVKEKEVATAGFGGVDERRGPSLFQFVVSVRPGKSFEEVEKLIYEEVERMKNEPVADWELEKVYAGLRRARAQSLQSTLSRSIQLSNFAIFYNDPGLINTFEAKMHKVTKADIQRVARTYLKDTNRTVIATSPKAAGPGARPTGAGQ
ncbi:MAG: insulinase family protein [Acidobacteria bacterium]|nr:insulinase family protein [Acidobacteriota bacterium]MCL5286954.1 insulinase family protein [Acidobacteriota bacterium]